LQSKYHAVIYVVSVALTSIFSINVSADTTLTDAETMEKLLNLDLEDLMEVRIVTIATGAKQTVTKAPATTNVITAEDIEALGASDLDEVLETLPGLHVSRTHNVYYRPLYVIRGIYSEANPEVLVLINGIPITSMYGGDRGYGWGGMSIHAISRIEAIRGPGSAVYGADAFAGVINIITKTKEDINGTEVGSRIGSFNTSDGWILHGGSWNGFDLATSLEYHTTQGHHGIIEEDRQTQYDKRFDTHVSYAPGPLNTGTDNVDARVDVKTGLWQARAGYQGRYNLGYGVGVAQALDPVGDVNAARTNADLTYHNPTLTSHWDVTTQLSYFGNSFKAYGVFFPPGAFGATYPDGYLSDTGVWERHLRLDTFAFYSGFQTHLIRIGAGYQHHNQYKTIDVRNYGIDPSTGQDLPPGSPMINATDTPYTGDHEGQRSNWYLSLQDAWTITDQWELTAGLRYDKYSDFGVAIHPGPHDETFIWAGVSVPFFCRVVLAECRECPDGRSQSEARED
jgi:iron complex outermembrane receptor protein